MSIATAVGPYLTFSEASQYTTLSESNLRHQVAAGKLKAHRVGRRLILAVVDLDAYIGGDPGQETD